jgi:hypothetical protein
MNEPVNLAQKLALFEERFLAADRRDDERLQDRGSEDRG